MHNLAFDNRTELEVCSVSTSPEQGNPSEGAVAQKTSVRTFISRLGCRRLLAACLVIALIAVVIAVSVYFGIKRNGEERNGEESNVRENHKEENVSCLASPPAGALHYSKDANFGAYVVLHWPWSSDMNNSDSQVYKESIMKADHWVKKIFQSSSQSSCIKSVAQHIVVVYSGDNTGDGDVTTSSFVTHVLTPNIAINLSKISCNGKAALHICAVSVHFFYNLEDTFIVGRLGGNIILLVQLNVTCQSMTEGDIQNAYEEGYSRLLTTQDKSCVSNINPKTSVRRITGPSPISSTICGQSQLYPAPRIVGGQQVHRGQYPWVVMLLRDGEFLCGGTIWDYSHILTAAHCVDWFLTNRSTGEVDTSVLEVIAGKREFDVGGYLGEQRVRVAAGRIHVNYSKEGALVNDIAILKLNQSLKPTQLVMKVCHPTADATLPEQGIVAGWGKTKQNSQSYSDLQLDVQLTLLDHNTCAKVLSFSLNRPDNLPIGTMCAIGNQLKDKDSCQGDSGGPLFWNLGTAAHERHTIIGVVSYGIGCADLGLPGVYASVQFYLKWIEDTIKAI